MTKRTVLLCLLVFLVIIIVITLINCIPYKVKLFHRDIFSNNESTSNINENSNNDFLKSSPLITVKLIHSGDLKVPLSKTINLNHPSCSGIEDKEIIVPIFAYLIHHEKYGYYLIDSGCDSSYVNNAFGPMKGFLFPLVMAETILEPDDAIEKQLSDIRTDIKGVFFTHLHFDHTSGLPALPDNILYIAGDGEKSFSIKGLLQPNHFEKNDTIYMLDFNSKESQTLPLGKVIDIFGDQTLWAISTPGHSKGHVSYLVNTQDHPILIAGDACILNKSMEIGVGPSASSKNLELAQDTFDNILNFVNNNPTVEVWAGHDFPK
jgi:glyoxylase-like metal-dependent hydrolase (beta-lactamase superfamily II)